MAHSPLRNAASERLKPSPPRDASFLLVVQLGEMRHCRNMCTYFERRGFHVVCGEKYGRRPETLQFTPDAIVCRVDGVRLSTQARPEFLSLAGFRRVTPNTPLVVLLVEAGPSAEEAQLASEAGAVLIHKRSASHDEVIATLHNLISRRPD